MRLVQQYRQFIDSIPILGRGCGRIIAFHVAPTPRDPYAKHNRFHAIIRRWHDIYGFDKGQDYTTLYERLNQKQYKRCEQTGKKIR
jgi:hypothetical protein